MKLFSRHGNSSNKIDMLNGPLAGKILRFAIPLMASGVLQQSFNSADVAVVGRFCSAQSLAAVASNGMIISLIVNLFIGISVGANVVIAQYIGRRETERIRQAVQTVALLSIICGLLLAAIGCLVSRPILEAISTPPDVLEPATLYLRIYFLGMPFLIIYNFGSAILRSVGDTKRPFYCLVAGGIVNVILNLILVILLKLDVAGVAIATVSGNLVASFLLVRLLVKEDEPIRLHPSKLRIVSAELNKMLRIGMPAGLQGMVFSFSNIFVVSGINTFGSVGSAGSGAALNFEYYCYFVIMAFASASVAFTSQNYAAGQISRCNRIFVLCLAMATVGCLALNIAITVQKEFFISFFTTDPEVMKYAFIRIEYVLLMQFIASSYEVAGATMRGLGYSMTPTVLTILGTCVLRLSWVYFFHSTSFVSSMEGLLIIYPITWVVTGILVCFAYVRIRGIAYSKVISQA